MVGLVFFLVFWVLAGACQRHGVGGLLLCNSSSSSRSARRRQLQRRRLWRRRRRRWRRRRRRRQRRGRGILPHEKNTTSRRSRSPHHRVFFRFVVSFVPSVAARAPCLCTKRAHSERNGAYASGGAQIKRALNGTRKKAVRRASTHDCERKKNPPDQRAGGLFGREGKQARGKRGLRRSRLRQLILLPDTWLCQIAAVLVVLVADDQQEEVKVSWLHVPSGVFEALQPAERLLYALGVNAL